MKIRDYNSVNWKEHFYLDETSPSGLCRLKNVYTPNGGLRYKANTPVGSRHYKVSGKPSSWEVKLGGTIYLAHRIIWILLYGSIDTELVIDHFDGDAFNNSYNNLKLKTARANCQNLSKNISNTSGTTGVHLQSYQKKDGTITKYWMATWHNPPRKIHTKCFPVNKYGYSLAKEMAVLARKEAIENLNLNGQSYTNRADSDCI